MGRPHELAVCGNAKPSVMRYDSCDMKHGAQLMPSWQNCAAAWCLVMHRAEEHKRQEGTML